LEVTDFFKEFVPICDYSYVAILAELHQKLSCDHAAIAFIGRLFITS
jgi:hypothetical protein